MDRRLTRKTLQKGDCYIVQSSQDEEDFKQIIPDSQYVRAVHPTYNAFKMQDMSKTQARKVLGITEDKKVILFLGICPQV